MFSGRATAPTNESVATSTIALPGKRSLMVASAGGRSSVHASLESSAMNVRPLHDRILVQRLDEGEQNIGGIIIPDSAKEKPQRGTVVAAGNGRQTTAG